MTYTRVSSISKNKEQKCSNVNGTSSIDKNAVNPFQKRSPACNLELFERSSVIVQVITIMTKSDIQFSRFDFDVSWF